MASHEQIRGWGGKREIEKSVTSCAWSWGRPAGRSWRTKPRRRPIRAPGTAPPSPPSSTTTSPRLSLSPSLPPFTLGPSCCCFGIPDSPSHHLLLRSNSLLLPAEFIARGKRSHRPIAFLTWLGGEEGDWSETATEVAAYSRFCHAPALLLGLGLGRDEPGRDPGDVRASAAADGWSWWLA